MVVIMKCTIMSSMCGLKTVSLSSFISEVVVTTAHTHDRVQVCNRIAGSLHKVCLACLPCLQLFLGI